MVITAWDWWSGRRPMPSQSTKAEKVGSGWVAVCNTNHFGIAGYYPLQALKHDLIGWAMTNSSKLVAPIWGAERMLGTNPIAIAFPGFEEPPIVIDMATSATAYGKIEIAVRKGQPLTAGWAVDSSGEVTLDPHAMINGGGAIGPRGRPRSWRPQGLLPVGDGRYPVQRFERSQLGTIRASLCAAPGNSEPEGRQRDRPFLRCASDCRFHRS